MFSIVGAESAICSDVTGVTVGTTGVTLGRTGVTVGTAGVIAAGMIGIVVGALADVAVAGAECGAGATVVLGSTVTEISTPSG